MAITFLHFNSNKPQIAGVDDSPGTYPTLKTYEDGFAVRISRPIPDRIALMVPLGAEFIDEALTKEEHVEWIKVLMANLKNSDAGLAGAKSGGIKKWTDAALTLGPKHTTVHLKAYAPSKTGKTDWRLRVEFCPGRLHSEGVVAVTYAIASASLGQLKLAKARAATRITRLDTACDFLGVDPLHLAVRTDLVSKTAHYLGVDGALETEYGFKLKKKKDGRVLGDAVYCLYDKRRQLLDAGLLPPHGTTPVTRVERRQRWKNNAPLFSEIATLPCAFDGIRLAYLRENAPKPISGWIQYAYLRRSVTAAQCIDLIGLPEAAASAMEGHYLSLPFNAFDRAEWWGYWVDSLLECGLDQFLVE